MSVKIPRGTFDILPEDSYKWTFLKKSFEQISRNFNYREITTPIFENAGLFERSVGDSSDIIEKEMYKFQDKKGRIFALRPEGTAPIVRSYVENNLNMAANSSKLYYIGPMFRYDRPQKGRYRQFYQYGIENIGSDDPYIDAEVILLGKMFLEKLGLNNFELQINSIGCANCSKDYDRALQEYFLPHKQELCSDCRKRLEINPKRLLDCKVLSCKEIAKNAPSNLDFLDSDCRDHFDGVQKYLKMMDVSFVINPKIVRGLDYYTKTAFEFIENSLGAQNTLIGGGRYDGLVQQLGGKNISGIGFAGGFERLLLTMENEKLSFGEQNNPQIFMVALGEEAKISGINLLSKFRRENVTSETAFEKSSMKAQMKAANRCNARFCLIIGEEEMRNKTVVFKNMESGNQEIVSVEAIFERVSKI